MSEVRIERELDRYLLFTEFASGGMASVHFGRLRGPVGFSRTVAIKKLLPQYARDPEFVAMFIDEARLAARVRHPNVATVADVIAIQDEMFLVMDYVHGESAAQLQRAARRLSQPMPPRIAAGILLGALHGLHAAHRATSETGALLGIVHRDVSPENILVGVDGIPRVLDFGIAFAVGRAAVTREGHIKGKLKYTAPELLEGKEATPAVDVYSAGVVLWELMVGRRLFPGDNEARVLFDILRTEIPSPSSLVAGLPAVLDTIVKKATARDPKSRYETADDFARDVEERLDPASAREIGAWVSKVAEDTLSARAELLASIEVARTDRSRPPTSTARDEDMKTDVDAFPRGASLDEATAKRPSTVIVEPEEPATLLDARPPLPARTLDASVIVPTEITRRPELPYVQPPARRSRALPIVAVALLFASLLVVSLIAFSSRTTSATSSGSASIPAGSVASASVATSVSAPQVTSSAMPITATIASTAPSPDPVPVPVAATTATAKTKTRSTDRSRGANCDPPYTVDQNGFHHFKPSCM